MYEEVLSNGSVTILCCLIHVQLEVYMSSAIPSTCRSNITSISHQGCLELQQCIRTKEASFYCYTVHVITDTSSHLFNSVSCVLTTLLVPSQVMTNIKCCSHILYTSNSVYYLCILTSACLCDCQLFCLFVLRVLHVELPIAGHKLICNHVIINAF